MDESVKLSEIVIMLGSQNDTKYIAPSHAKRICRACDITISIEVASAHRNPERVQAICEAADPEKHFAFIAAAGMSAALPGTAAALLLLKGIKVYGVALTNGPFKGDEAFKSIGVMPPGIPTAFAGFDDVGFTNAAIMACLDVAAKRPEVKDDVIAYIQSMIDAKPPRGNLELPDPPKKD